MLRTVTATRYVAPLREGGSLPAIIEADDDGLYVVKFRGAGQGPKALVAEVLAGEIGRLLGLTVPEIVLVDIDPVLGNAEPDPEIQDLLERSPGTNVGLDFLPGALPFDPGARPRPAADFAADLVWFDALVTNVDRTARNVNLLTWHGRVWLIDHGAALYVHHTWRDPRSHARRPFERIRDHVMLPAASSIPEADARLAPILTREAIEEVVATIPEALLTPEDGLPNPESHRRAYVEYLLRRLEGPRPFVEEAERARAA